MSAIAAVSSVSPISPVRPIAPAREPATGRFVPAGRLWAIRPVALPGGAQGWQVGPEGRVYAKREHAEAFAMSRRNRNVKV